MSEHPKPSEQEIKEAEEARWLAEMLAMCEAENPAPTELRDCAPEIAELEGLLETFENNHSLAELQLITDLTPEEASNHPIRKPANNDLTPIANLLDNLKNKTNIPPEKYEELQIKYKRLSRAVGILNNNKVDHDR